MNKREHVLNAVLLTFGIAFVFHPSMEPWPAETIVIYGVPILLGTLLPDVDAVIGTHRKSFHNVWFLAFAVGYPLAFDNLHFVWIGVLTHYVLDLLGNVGGMALLYPYPKLYRVPFGVSGASRWADVVTVVVTGIEIWAIYVIVQYALPLPYWDVLKHLVGA